MFDPRVIAPASQSEFRLASTDVLEPPGSSARAVTVCWVFQIGTYLGLNTITGVHDLTTSNSSLDCLEVRRRSSALFFAPVLYDQPQMGVIACAWLTRNHVVSRSASSPRSTRTLTQARPGTDRMRHSMSFHERLMNLSLMNISEHRLLFSLFVLSSRVFAARRLATRPTPAAGTAPTMDLRATAKLAERVRLARISSTTRGCRSTETLMGRPATR